MRVSLMIEGEDQVAWEEWVALARAAEAAGIEGLFTADHYLPIPRTTRGAIRASSVVKRASSSMSAVVSPGRPSIM